MLSAKKHWLVLRLTAVAAIPLCIWLVLNIVGLIGAPYEVFIAWVQNPVNAVLLIVTIVVSFYHAMLGVHEILEDYVHAPGLLKASMTAKAVAFIAVGAVCIYSIIKIAFIGT
jgi:succinate dehydrogenase / fumarate reductase, membrane anchor subunit